MKIIPEPVSPTLDYDRKRFHHFGLIVRTIDDEQTDCLSEFDNMHRWSDFARFPPLDDDSDSDDDDLLFQEHELSDVSLDNEAIEELALREEATTLPKPKKLVSFGKVEIREYCRVLGDHPIPADGFPLSLGWAYNPTLVVREIMDDDDYRSTCPSKPRRLRVGERKKLLKSIGGYTEQQLRRAEESRRRRVEQEWYFLNADPDAADDYCDCDDLDFCDDAEESSASNALRHSSMLRQLQTSF